jgi:hypothetical protein
MRWILREARALLDRFDRTESGDLFVLPSKGQQEALWGQNRWPAGACLGHGRSVARACYWQTDRHTVAAFGVVKSGIAKLPRGVGWASLLGYACLAGIGFTMSLFVAMLAFDETGPLNAAKSGILAG